VNRCALPPCMCLTQVYEIDCDALICGPPLRPSQIRPAQMQFCRPARCTATSGATAGRSGPGLAAGCGRPWISPPPGGIPGRLVPVPLSPMAGRPFPVTPPRAWAGPSFRSFCPGKRHYRRELAAGHVRAGPVARAGAARCRLMFWPGHGSDVAGSNAAAVPRAAG
jgi:hypothetical protein